MIAQMKVYFVSSELFVSDYATWSQDLVTLWDVIFYLFYKHADVQIKTECLH